MQFRKTNGQMSEYVPGCICLDGTIRFTLTPELIEDLKDDPNAEFFYPIGEKAYCIFTFKDWWETKVTRVDFALIYEGLKPGNPFYNPDKT